MADVQPFSVFLPVYNEEAILVANTEALLRFCEGLQRPFEIILGSNGSTDRTRELGEALQQRDPRVQFFHLPEPGPGEALKTASLRARYPWIVCLDMDLSSDLRFVPEALRLLETHDIVIGSKKMGTERRTLIRRFGSDLFIWCSRVLLRLPFNDYSLGAKAYRASVLRRYRVLIDQGTAYVQKIVYYAYRDGLRVTQIAVQCDDHRASRFNLLREGAYRFARLFALWWSARHR